MKIVFTAIIMLICFAISAQDCSTSALFKKGTVLTYKNQQMLLAVFKTKYIDITRLVYTVDDVKDSNNIKYSYITKTGVNPGNDKQRYEKKYVVACDGKMVTIPIDFYMVDTVYLSNMYSDTKDNGIYSAMNVTGNVKSGFPLDTKTGKPTLPNGEVKMTSKMRMFMPNTDTKYTRPDKLQEYQIEGSYTAKKMEVVGEENVKTDAGSYPCIKIKMDTETKGLPEGAGVGNGTMLYNAAIGVVRTEAYYKSKLMTFMELTSIK